LANLSLIYTEKRLKL